MTEPETYIEEPCRWCSKPIRKSPFADYPYVHQHDGASYCDGLLHRAEPNTTARQTYIEEQDMCKQLYFAADAMVEELYHNTGECWDEVAETLAKRVIRAEDQLTHIRAYASEAAQPIITREEMHDPMKAQAIYDEYMGLLRLVSEVKETE